MLQYAFKFSIAPRLAYNAYGVRVGPASTVAVAALLDTGAFEDEGTLSLVIDGSPGFLEKLSSLKELQNVGVAECLKPADGNSDSSICSWHMLFGSHVQAHWVLENQSRALQPRGAPVADMIAFELALLVEQHGWERLVWASSKPPQADELASSSHRFRISKLA